MTSLRRLPRLTCLTRRPALTLAALLCLAVPLPAHASPEPAQQEQLHTATPTELAVVKVLLAQETAWNHGDLDTFTQAYKDSPDTIFISREVSHGFAGMLESYRREYPNRAAMGTLGYTELEVHPLDDNFAAVVGKYHLDRSKKAGGNADGVFSLVFEKTSRGWKIVVDHTT